MRPSHSREAQNFFRHAHPHRHSAFRHAPHRHLLRRDQTGRRTSGLLKLVAPADVARDTEERLRAGGLGYGDLKKALFEHYWTFFAPARQCRAELAANLDYVNQVLAQGAARARLEATKVLKAARRA